MTDFLKSSAVVGAGGKMGRGIALLLLQEMARSEAEKAGNIGQGACRLYLIDSELEALRSLREYLKKQLTRYAEHHIISLRNYFSRDPRLVSNEQIIEAFTAGAMELITVGTEASLAGRASLVFEAIAEDVEIKSKVLAEIASHANEKTFFFSNTSSIPIHVLADKANIPSRLIGFHFYNPPPLQKLVELIVPEQADPHLLPLAHKIAEKLHKNIVRSSDVAGFIGNGHFIREIRFACDTVKELSRDTSIVESIYMVNRITQDYLIRPMGIFQLVDFVGIDICHQISSIMSTYLPDEVFQLSLLDEMLERGIAGGQNADGSQKKGFFEYEGQKRIAAYSPNNQEYRSFTQGNWVEACEKQLGPLPSGHFPWKTLVKDPAKAEKLRTYFEHLYHQKTLGSELARSFLLQSYEIAQLLVRKGVAESLQDMSQVLCEGFYHLYGPGDYFQGGMKP